jgi:site-specific recombinase XerD
MAQLQRVLAVPTRRFERRAVSYFSEKELRLLLAQPDLTSTRGRRDAVLLSIMYDTAGRAAEILALSARDVRLNSPAQVLLHGKGGKQRAVPLMKPTVAALKTYMRETGLDHPAQVDQRLFRNSRGEPLTKSGLRYVLAKYTRRAAKVDPTFQARVHPHMFRHSKAMHLVESGCPLPYVRDLLGHEDLRTTSIYARTNLELQRAALQNAARGSTAPRIRYRQPRQDLLTMLRSL